jgi:hypothetical protein
VELREEGKGLTNLHQIYQIRGEDAALQTLQDRRGHRCRFSPESEGRGKSPGQKVAKLEHVSNMRPHTTNVQVNAHEKEYHT